MHLLLGPLGLGKSDAMSMPTVRTAMSPAQYKIHPARFVKNLARRA